ncbi:5257_t:CDS:1, partial [Entrophospora sp. SA101]
YVIMPKNGQKLRSMQRFIRKHNPGHPIPWNAYPPKKRHE